MTSTTAEKLIFRDYFKEGRILLIDLAEKYCLRVGNTMFFRKKKYMENLLDQTDNQLDQLGKEAAIFAVRD
jgi:hypothetical protein